MSLNVEPITLQNEAFNTTEPGRTIEKVLLNGRYTMKRYYNPHPDLNKIIDYYDDIGGLSHFHCKQMYVLGNILYNPDVPEIDTLIDLMIKCTYEEKLPTYVDTSVKSKKQMMGGTICPTKEVAFRYKGKIFTLYGRYIYGYGIPYVHFLNEKPTKVIDDDENDDDYNSDDEDEEEEKEAKLTRDEIILPTISYKDKNEKDAQLDEYNFCFSITDEANKVLDAFAIYR